MSSGDGGRPYRTPQEHTFTDNADPWSWTSDWNTATPSRASLTRADVRHQQDSPITESMLFMTLEGESASAFSTPTNGTSLRRRKRSTQGHRRAITSSGSGGSPTPANVTHPLERSASASSSRAGTYGTIDSGVTRPTLRRRMSSPVGERPRRSSIPKDIRAGRHAYPHGSKDEMDVIVHNVSSTDSLAGVALKYGISLADLRRANKLWASDTIHMRQVLHIPIEWTTKNWTVIRSEHERNGYEETEHDKDGHGDPMVYAVCGGPELSSDMRVPVLRVHVSQIAFFPPASVLQRRPQISIATSTLPSISREDKFRTAPAIKNRPPFSNSTSARTSLTSLFSSLQRNIPALIPSPDKFVPRLSADSYFSSSTSNLLLDGRSDSTTTPSESTEQEHELDIIRSPAVTVVANKGKSRLRSHSPIRSCQSDPSRNSSSSPPLPTEYTMYSMPMGIRRRAAASVEQGIRTRQLEPSPMMRLPFTEASDPG